MNFYWKSSVGSQNLSPLTVFAGADMMALICLLPLVFVAQIKYYYYYFIFNKHQFLSNSKILIV